QQINQLGSQDSEGELAGYDWSSHGFLIGVENLINQRLLVGASAGGVWTSLDGDMDAKGGSSELVVGTLYGNWRADVWYADVGLLCGSADNEAERTDSAGDSYNGEFSSMLFGGWLEGGYMFPKDTYQIEPYGRSVYIAASNDEYTDSGGAAPMTVEDTDADSWIMELGIRGKKGWELDSGGKIQVSLKGAWRTELLDNEVSAQGTILGVSQTFESVEAGKNALVLGLKTDWLINDKFALGLNYEPVISGNWVYHNLNGELSYRF
ncbi:MAG: autotransporter outer membrane beta-barrel domain-containing protein, partial [Kiritimatiellaceae bacterium]|nr:autotransporter outer membrane beta-barrel domain-containing protein [Kiritimatiellaceae bacterium]